MELTLDFLRALVKEVRPIIFDRGLAAEYSEKGDSDYVTAADVGVQKYIEKRLKEACPECRFVGEESDNRDVDDEVPTFILDPIDGTTNFIHDFHLSTVSLALVQYGKTQKAVIYNPYADEMFSAELGGGAYLNGKPIHVSNHPELKQALVAVGTMPYTKDVTGKLFGMFRELYMIGTDIRRIGAASIDACYVAAGRMDCYVERGLYPYDFAASRLIVTEAGGVFTDWDGNETGLEDVRYAIAVSNGKFHSELLGIVEKYKNV